MLNPCRPCCCPGAPCEQCGFGYRTREENHESMKQLLIEFNAGEKPIGWKAAELYMFYHSDWKSELPELPEKKIEAPMNIVEALGKHGIKIATPKEPISNKCYGCLFSGEYRDMGASTPICSRERDLASAFNAHGKTGPCQWYITRDQVRELQEVLLKGD